MRNFLLLVGAIQLGFAVAFFVQWEPAVGLWPFEGTTPLTFIFVSSIFAAAGASTLWAAGSRNDGALTGIGLDYVAILAPLAFYTMRLGARTDDREIVLYGVACALGAAFGVALVLWGLRRPLDGTLPMPQAVRASFVVFIVALLFVATRLLFGVDTIPWKLTSELSVLIAWMFYGAALYFTYALARPSWLNSAGQLIGFLAYDLVLIVPFLQRLPSTAPEFKVGLTLYTVVVVYSGLLATYYLVVNQATRARTWTRAPE
jgi:hypothetical protein